MISYPEIPTTTIHPISHGASPRIELLPAIDPPPPIAAAINNLWAELRRDNPRLHDGPILITDPLHTTLSRATGSPRFARAHTGLALIARHATYKTLATAADVGMHVRALGVQGIVTARDASGEEHLLLGRRGSEVRIYQGLWENAPSGTLPPPVPGASLIDQSHFTQALLAEGIEELGLNLSAASISWLAMLDDAEARSLDVVLKLQMQQPIDPRATPCATDDTHPWEYAATQWTPLATLGAWAAQNAHAISPPTLALIRWITLSQAR